MTEKILVLGASGNVGWPLVAELVARGERVKAASRSAKPAPGAEAVRFDYADQASIDAALADVDRAFVLAPTGSLDIVGLLTPVLTTATRRNIKIVLQTAIGVEADDSIPYRQMELFVERSGAPFVILRPNWFSDNFHNYWREGVRRGAIAVPAADAQSSFVDARDIAASAAAALTSNAHDGQALTLTGPAAYSYGDAAAILSTATGRKIVYTSIDDEAFIAMLMEAQVPADYAKFLAFLFQPVRAGWTAPVTDAVRGLTGKPPRSLEAYARDRAAAFAP